ncbi:hypothetical protein BH10BAC1_BH10BAC1_17380 [soil metagenome]
MDPLFETQTALLIKVYFDYFQITWESNLPLPEDKYLYKEVNNLEIIMGCERKKSIPDILYRWLLQNRHAARIDDYDELEITFKTGEVETRYIHGQATESILEAVEIINSKLNLREKKK